MCILSGVVGSDDVHVYIDSATFDNKNVGINKTVTVVYGLYGENVDKYQTPASQEFKADITPCPIEVMGTMAEDKFYDGNCATKAIVGQTSGIYTDDDVAVSAKGTFENANLGSNKEVNIKYSLSGKDAGNYSVPEDTMATASIRNAGFIAQGKSYKKSVSYSWNPVSGATKYKVYQAKCGKKKYKCVKTTSGLSFTKKNLKRKSTYKTYVVAYDASGKKLTQTPIIHNMTKGGCKANATAVSAKSTININTGKTESVNAKITSKDSKKKLLWKHHVSAQIRYYSSDTSVATVDSKGTVTCKGKGTAIIYSVAPTGVCAKTVIKNPSFVLDCWNLNQAKAFSYSLDGGDTYISTGLYFEVSLYSDSVIIRSDVQGGSALRVQWGDDQSIELGNGETKRFNNNGETQTIKIDTIS